MPSTIRNNCIKDGEGGVLMRWPTVYRIKVHKRLYNMYATFYKSDWKCKNYLLGKVSLFCDLKIPYQ